MTVLLEEFDMLMNLAIHTITYVNFSGKYPFQAIAGQRGTSREHQQRTKVHQVKKTVILWLGVKIC